MKLAVALIGAALCAAPAVAKLPPPTPEERAAQETRRAQEEARLAKEKALLEQAQERVAERYRQGRAAGGGAVRAGDLPNPVRELPGRAPPEGGKEQSAEAHSAPAK